MPTLRGIRFQHDALKPSVTFWQSVTASRGTNVWGGEVRGAALHKNMEVAMTNMDSESMAKYGQEELRNAGPAEL